MTAADRRRLTRVRRYMPEMLTGLLAVACVVVAWRVGWIT